MYVNIPKNRKPLIVALKHTMVNILLEYLKYRQHKTDEEYLFYNVFGEQFTKSACYHMLYLYNKGRGVNTMVFIGIGTLLQNNGY